MGFSCIQILCHVHLHSSTQQHSLYVLLNITLFSQLLHNRSTASSLNLGTFLLAVAFAFLYSAVCISAPILFGVFSLCFISLTASSVLLLTFPNRLHSFFPPSFHAFQIRRGEGGHERCKHRLAQFRMALRLSSSRLAPIPRLQHPGHLSVVTLHVSRYNR